MRMDSVIAPVLFSSSKFRFMGCLVKANALVSENRSSLSQLIVYWFINCFYSHLQRDILANVFSLVFS